MEFLEIIHRIKHQEDSTSPEGLILLVNELRPPKNNPGQGSENLKALVQFLQKHQWEKEALKAYFNHFIVSRHLVPLLTNSGILTNKGFFAEASERVSSRILPRAYQDSDHSGAFNELFHKPWG
jgi:site-specific recombinase